MNDAVRETTEIVCGIVLAYEAVSTNKAVSAVVILTDADTHDADIAALGTKLIAYAFPALAAYDADMLAEAQDALVAVSDCVAI